MIANVNIAMGLCSTPDGDDNIAAHQSDQDNVVTCRAGLPTMLEMSSKISPPVRPGQKHQATTATSRTRPNAGTEEANRRGPRPVSVAMVFKVKARWLAAGALGPDARTAVLTAY